MTTEEPKPRSRTRRALGVVIPAVLVLGAASGGLAYTRKTVDEADRTVPTTLWSRAEGSSGTAKDPVGNAPVQGQASTPMSKLLLPVPDDYKLGPDIEEYGNDGEISGKQATQLLKDGGRGLSGKKRRDFEKRIEKLGVRGVAVRSYLSNTNDLLVEVHIVRMKDEKHLHDLHKLRVGLAEFLKFKKGPSIKGHKKAACYLVPMENASGKKTELEGMDCVAHTGDIQVTVSAAGTKPFEKSDVADLVKRQLDHIAAPGEYV
ncbi:hypothetical protein [Streptomyces sp. TRM64462]|uniref:hypothetical protein n=1 Tax=Streptomyces sp. TRM64462 TaxID=2741726 RepID=UPI001585FFF6|nr:hypothetical protein [Streptomyces sp. TRM64462]